MRFLERTILVVLLGAGMTMGCVGSGRGMRAARDAREVRAPEVPEEAARSSRDSSDSSEPEEAGVAMHESPR